MGPRRHMVGLDLERAAKVVDRRVTIAFAFARPPTLDERVARSAGDSERTIGIRDRLVELAGLDITPRPLAVRLVIAPLEIDQAGQVLDRRAMIAKLGVESARRPWAGPKLALRSIERARSSSARSRFSPSA